MADVRFLALLIVLFALPAHAMSDGVAAVVGFVVEAMQDPDDGGNDD